MSIFQFKMSCTFQSFLTLSVTIHCTRGQIKNADFMGIVSLPLASSSVFDVDQDFLSKISMKAAEGDMIQNRQTLFDTWQSHGSLPGMQKSRMKTSTILSDSLHGHKEMSSTSVIPAADKRIKLQICSRCFRHNQNATYCEKAFPRLLKRSTYGFPKNRCLYHVLNSSCANRFTHSVLILDGLNKACDSSVLPLPKFVKQVKKLLDCPEIEKCRQSETQLTFKACLLKETKCNSLQEYFQESFRIYKLFKIVSNLQNVLNLTPPLRKMDPLDLMSNNGEIADLGDVNELGLLARVAEAEIYFEEEEVDNDNIHVPAAQQNYDIYGNDESEFHYDSEEDPLDTFHGSYRNPSDIGHPAIPRRTPSPSAVAIEDIVRAREFMEFDNRMMLSFRMPSSQASVDCEQDLSDLENSDQDPPPTSSVSQ